MLSQITVDEPANVHLGASIPNSGLRACPGGKLDEARWVVHRTSQSSQPTDRTETYVRRFLAMNPTLKQIRSRSSFYPTAKHLASTIIKRPTRNREQPMTKLPQAPPPTSADIAQATSRKPLHVVRYAWPTLGIVLFIVGINGNFWIGVLGGMVLLFSAGAALNRRDDRTLRTAGHGAVRVETVKQVWVNQKVQQYARAGWQLDSQSSAKSLGSQARVTLTFRKP